MRRSSRVPGDTGPASNRRFRPGAAATLLAGILVSAPTLASGVYKWVDQNGKVHYGDRPPASAAPSEVEIEKKPAASAVDADRREKTQRLLDAIESEREQEKKDTARDEARSAQRKRNCAIAKRRLEMLEEANTVSVTGDDGQRRYLNDQERAAAMKQAERLVRQWC